AANEARLAALLRGFAALGAAPIVLAEPGAAAVNRAFLDWANRRRIGRRAAGGFCASRLPFCSPPRRPPPSPPAPGGRGRGGGARGGGRAADRPDRGDGNAVGAHGPVRPAARRAAGPRRGSRAGRSGGDRRADVVLPVPRRRPARRAAGATRQSDDPP